MGDGWAANGSERGRRHGGVSLTSFSSLNTEAGFGDFELSCHVSCKHFLEGKRTRCWGGGWCSVSWPPAVIPFQGSWLLLSLILPKLYDVPHIGGQTTGPPFRQVFIGQLL